MRYQDWSYLLYMASNFYISYLICKENTYFLDIALIDFRRRSYMMKICGIIIEPNRNRLALIDKIYPLINIFDKHSMLSWLDTRILALDVG